MRFGIEDLELGYLLLNRLLKLSVIIICISRCIGTIKVNFMPYIRRRNFERVNQIFQTEDSFSKLCRIMGNWSKCIFQSSYRNVISTGL